MGSIRKNSRDGSTIFKGIPGKPPPVPISAIVPERETYFKTRRESIKCFIATSSWFFMEVIFIVLFHSSIKKR